MVIMDKNKWSESSKRSFAYAGSRNTHYEDFGYWCVKCQQHAIFSAADQKIAFEEKKQYIWKRRSLCSHCFLTLEALRKRESDMQKRWESNKTILQKDYGFLCEWINVLEEIPTYRKRANPCMLHALQKWADACRGQAC